MKAVKPNPGRLGYELPAIGGGGVIARKVGARLTRDDREGGHVPRVLGVVRVGGGGHEGALLGQELDAYTFELIRMDSDRAREAAIRNAADKPTEPEEHQPGELKDE